LAFLANLRELDQIASQQPKEPKDYGPKTVDGACERLLHNYRPLPNPEKKPDIVLIACEALFDPTLLPNISHSTDWLSNIHRLQNEGKGFQLVSPTFGGLSMNADFEILTGLSTRFCGSREGAITDPLDHELPNLANVLEAHGYETYAIIAAPKTLFRSSWVFPHLFSFRHSEFMEELGGTTLGDIPDYKIAKRILNILAEPSARPRFIYAQFEHNHFPWDEKKHYNHPEVIPNHGLSGTEAKSFNYYIEGVYELDQTIGALANELTARNHSAILSLYGDHLPALGNSTLVSVGAMAEGGPNAPQNALSAHTTPGLVWNTPDMGQTEIRGFAVGKPTGMNYLISAILQDASISHPFYTTFLSKIHAGLPVMNFTTLCDANGQVIHAPPSSVLTEYNDYHLIEYDMLFGKRYAAPKLFPELVRRP
jgi:hypothetical protein